MATPVVSGSLALLLEKYPFYTNKDVKMKLRKNCDKLKTPRHHQEGTEKHTIFILTLIKKKKSIRVFMILVDFLLDKI